MYSRLITHQNKKSFFLFGPRGTGKTYWIKNQFPNAVYLDLLEAGLFTKLLANPQRLGEFIPQGFHDWIILDEVQKIPQLLDEVHRLIESKKYKFVLTGSSARKLKQKGVNLLAGRALTFFMHPLTAKEVGKDFNLERALECGQLPSVYQEEDPKKYLASYVKTYLQEEVQQEGLTRNIGAFTRFLEAASFSQGSTLSITEVSRECSVDRKVAENYFKILEDLLLAIRLPVFTKRAKRRIAAHPKFYFFDVGVWRAVRPMGPLDKPEEVGGIALESLVFQELKALNDYFDLGYTLHYWQTANKLEIDFVLYGEKGIAALEVKRTKNVQPKMLGALNAFLEDYPMAKAYLLYGGDKKLQIGKVSIIPITEFFEDAMRFI